MTVLAAVGVCLAVLVWPMRVSAVIPRKRRGVRAAMARLYRRIDTSDRDVLTTMVEGITPAVAAGVTPASAVATAAVLAAGRVNDATLRDDLRRLAREASAGDELAPLWAELAARHTSPGLAEVARAWALSERLGCAIGDALDVAAGMMREQLDLERRLTAATAGPRATMQLLTMLPVLGVLIAAVIGVPPWRMYAGTLGASVLLLGIGFVAAGRAVTRRMIRRASAPAALT